MLISFAVHTYIVGMTAGCTLTFVRATEAGVSWKAHMFFASYAGCWVFDTPNRRSSSEYHYSSIPDLTVPSRVRVMGCQFMASIHLCFTVTLHQNTFKKHVAGF